MKFALTVLFCLLITFQFKAALGGTVLNFFEKAHERAHERAEEARDNIRNLFHLDNHVTETATDNNKNQIPAGETVINRNSAVTTPYTNKQTEGAIIFPTEESNSVSNNTDTTTTEKDGRENFTGGCEPGYERTTDGRCMPTF